MLKGALLGSSALAMTILVLALLQPSIAPVLSLALAVSPLTVVVAAQREALRASKAGTASSRRIAEQHASVPAVEVQEEAHSGFNLLAGASLTEGVFGSAVEEAVEAA